MRNAQHDANVEYRSDICLGGTQTTMCSSLAQACRDTLGKAWAACANDTGESAAWYTQIARLTKESKMYRVTQRTCLMLLDVLRGWGCQKSWHKDARRLRETSLIDRSIHKHSIYLLQTLRMAFLVIPYTWYTFQPCGTCALQRNHISTSTDLCVLQSDPA